jgi:glutamyl/glutaminyl-tRNA synthetase
MLFTREKPKVEIPQEKLKFLQKFVESINESDDLHAKFQEYLKENNVKFKDIGPDFRMVLIGTASSIAIFDVIDVLGFEEAKNRILNPTS